MKVIKHFIDKTDLSSFNPGDKYPRDNVKEDAGRIADLKRLGYIDDEEGPEADEAPKKTAKKAPTKKKKES